MRGRGMDVAHAARPTAAAPTWLGVLTLTSRRLSSPSADIAARAVIAAPTSRHVPAAAALAAVALPTGAARPLPQPGWRVATVLSGCLTDASVRSNGSRLLIDGVQFDPSRCVAPTFRLPDDWGWQRCERHVPVDAVEHLTGLRPGNASWTYFDLCTAPVVILTHHPGPVADDMADLAEMWEWWSPEQRAALAEPEAGLDWWFRRPVLVATPGSVLAEPWIAGLPASRVVVVGYSAWTHPARHVWREAPQLLVLNQRGGDVAEFRDWFDGTDFPTVPMPFKGALGKAGVTVEAFGEPINEMQPPAGEVADEEDEWLF